MFEFFWWNTSLFSFYSHRQHCCLIRTMYTKKVKNLIWKWWDPLHWEVEQKRPWGGALMNAGSLDMMLKLDCCHHSRYDRLQLDIKYPINIWKIQLFDKTVLSRLPQTPISEHLKKHVQIMFTILGGWNTTLSVFILRDFCSLTTKLSMSQYVVILYKVFGKNNDGNWYSFCRSASG